MNQKEEPDELIREERTDKGYRITVESTRGTGTRDQDKVKGEIRKETRPSNPEINALLSDVRHCIDQRRHHTPDEDGEDDE